MKVDLYREPHRNPEHDIERAIAGQVLIQAMRDYHTAKKFIQRKNVAFRYHCRRSLDFLTDLEREMVMNGKEAWEWFVNDPLPNCEGWTFQQCCEMLGYDPDEIRVKALTPATHRKFESLNVGAFRPNHRKRNTRGQRRPRVLRADGGEVSKAGKSSIGAGGGVAGTLCAAGFDTERTHVEQHLDPGR